MPVVITATGGGLSGSATVVLLGPPRLDLTATPDSVATGGTSTLTATIAGDGTSVPANVTLTFTLDTPSVGTLRWTDTGVTGATLTGVPRSVAAGGGIVFEAVARQTPARAAGGAAAFRDSTVADSVWAGARVTATVDGRADLTDDARIAVGGTARLGVAVACTGAGADRACTVTVTLPPGGCAAWPDVTIRASGVRGDLVVPSTGQRVTVGESGGSVTVPACLVSSGGVTFEPDETGTIRIGTITAEFVGPAYTPSGEPVLPGEAPVTSGPVPGGGGGGGGGTCSGTASRDGDLTAGCNISVFDQGGYEVTAGYVMVSKVRPDWLLPEENLPFAVLQAPLTRFSDNGYPGSTAPANVYDPHTYRPEARGLDGDVPAASIEFRLYVSNGGNPVSLWAYGEEGLYPESYAKFDAVCQPEGEGSQVCRASRYARLVSNSRPPEMQGTVGCYAAPTYEGGCYDDEVADMQTVRVGLGDDVRWEVWVYDVSERSRSYAVGSHDPVPILSRPEDIVQTARIRFTETEGLEKPTDVFETVQRMNETWAQAAVRFDLLGNPVDPNSVVARTLYNVIEINHPDEDTGVLPTVPADGTIKVEVTVPGQSPVTVSINVGEGDDVDVVAARLAKALLRQELTARAVLHRVRLHAPGNPVDYRSLIHVAEGAQLGFTLDEGETGLVLAVRSVTGSTLASPSAPADGRDHEELLMAEMHALALNYADADPSTVDVFVIPDAAMARVQHPTPTGGTRSPFVAFAFPAGGFTGNLPGLVNAAVLGASSADGRDNEGPSTADDQPETAAHEMGHILLDTHFPGSGDLGHDPSVTTNLMAVGVYGVHEESPGGGKRISQVQHEDTRTDPSGILSPALPSDRPAADHAATQTLQQPSTDD